MSVPRGPMQERFNRARIEHMWGIARKGPTELGYAYFRARRRRRNIADDEPVLSESDELALSGAFDVDRESFAEHQAIIDSYRRSGPIEIRSVQWFLPFFSHAYYGGIHTLLRFADYFARVHGVENRFHCYDVDRRAVPGMVRKVSEAFPALSGTSFTSATDLAPDRLPAADAAVATLWTSAYPLVRMRDVRAKFYLVQDYEPQFYPAGAASALVEETYRFSLPGIVNTPGLADVYRSYGNPGVSFVPAVDLNRYYPATEPRNGSAPIRVFFYGRTHAPRNAFGLGLAALAKVKETFGDRVEVICAGENWHPAAFGVAGRIRNLGVLGSLDEVAALYRSCDIGLVFMLTKHPSYQPFEFMASGMATVSNINPATEWLLRDGENCLLTRPLASMTAEKLELLMNDESLRHRIAEAGLAEVGRYHWDDQIERVWAAMCRRDSVFALPAADG